MLGDAESVGDLGAALGGGLWEREALYQREHEWAREPDDVLWRRTKCALHMDTAQKIAAHEALTRIL
jgi:glycerol-3-phosphate dehydrogenase